MTYYVLAVDGKTYGPVDVEGLKQWHREGRLVPNSRLREATTGRELLASEVPELRPLFGIGTAPPPGYGYGPQSARCPHCGGAMGPGDVQCGQCGTVLGYGHQPRSLITGSLTGDRIFGFLVGFFSWFLWGIGALGGLVVYFIVRGNYPIFARSLGFGLSFMLVIGFGLLALCIAGLMRIGY